MNGDRAPSGRALHPFLLLVLAAGCAASGGGGTGGAGAEPPDASVDRALEQRSEERISGAKDRLLDLWRRCGTSPLGERALLLYASVALDPRKEREERDPGRAAAAAARLIRTPGRSAWADLTARALYLIALDLSPGGTADAGAFPRPEPAAGATCAYGRTVLDEPGDLPSLPGAPFARRHMILRAWVDSLEREIQRLKELLEGSGGGP